MVQILNLTYQYDQQQFFHFTKKIETLKKTVQNNRYLIPFEKIVFKYLKELINIQNEKKALELNRQEKKSLIQNTFKNFKIDLLNLKVMQEKFIKPKGYEVLMIWIESKI